MSVYSLKIQGWKEVSFKTIIYIHLIFEMRVKIEKIIFLNM